MTCDKKTGGGVMLHQDTPIHRSDETLSQARTRYIGTSIGLLLYHSLNLPLFAKQQQRISINT